VFATTRAWEVEEDDVDVALNGTRRWMRRRNDKWKEEEMEEEDKNITINITRRRWRRRNDEWKGRWRRMNDEWKEDKMVEEKER
jgi:hypothetical protein